MSNTIKPGDIRRWDMQSDVWQGRYQVIEAVEGKPRTWVIENLEMTDEEIDEILADDNPYCGGEREVLWRIENWVGRRMEIRIVSAAEFARHF